MKPASVLSAFLVPWGLVLLLAANPAAAQEKAAKGGEKETAAPAALGRDDNNTQHVFFRSTDGDIMELYWSKDAGWQRGNLTAATKAPKAASQPAAYVLKYGKNTQHVIYRGDDGQIHELSFPSAEGKWAHNNLTAATKAPKAEGNPCGYVFDDTTQHVAFRTGDGDVCELNHQPKGDRPGWHLNNLTTNAKAPKAAGDPFGYAFDNALHVVYCGSDGAIVELSYKPGDSKNWTANNLTAAARAPKAAGDPHGYVLKYGKNTQHVIYRGDDGQIHELSSPKPDGGGWAYNNLTAATKAPKAEGNPCGYVFDDTTQHVAFRTGDGDICELNHQPKGDHPGWHLNNLTASAKGPKAASDPAGYVLDKTQHVFFRGTDGHIYELSFRPGTSPRWQFANLTAEAKGR